MHELRVERGRPTDDELAALVTVLLGGSRPAPPAASEPVSWWRLSTRPVAVDKPGPDTWRASTLPRS